MLHINILQQLLCITTILTVRVTGELPQFRILAPEFVCPKDEEATQVKPDNTIITISTKAGLKLGMNWTVRWTPLPAPTQRFTLMLWRATRALEKKLNGPQIEPYVYVIENEELLRGVNYVFNVTASNSNGEATAKSFDINNVLGDQKLENIEDRSDMLSIMLVGGQQTYADTEFVMEAQVTTCFPTQDYYFEWTVESTETEDKFDSASMSSRLEIPAYSLKAGLTYFVSCQVVSHSTGNFITKKGLPITVLQRTFEVYWNVDRLTVSINTAFTMESTTLNHDYFGDFLTDFENFLAACCGSEMLQFLDYFLIRADLARVLDRLKEEPYKWECTYDGHPCNFFESADNDTIVFENGLPNAGEYEVTLSVSVQNHSASASAVIIAVQHILPVIQISPPLPRVLNKDTKIYLIANATNVTPTCSLTWFFASEEYLLSQNQVLNGSCEDCQHGEPLTETLVVNSLEENFLYDLTDFTNETEWKQVTAEMQAREGRARFVVQCGCTIMFDCDSQGSVYADMFFKLNGISKANYVMVSPETGSALETIFRISTLAVVDPNTPLYYTFYCRVGVNSTLILGSYAEHLAVATFLPFIENGTEIWVEVCDVLGACSDSASKVVNLSTGDGATVAALLEDARAHVRRCELMQLQRVAVAAVVTYRNAGQSEALTEFCTNLLNTLPTAQEDCPRTKPDRYEAFLMQLTDLGCDTTNLLNITSLW